MKGTWRDLRDPETVAIFEATFQSSIATLLVRRTLCHFLGYPNVWLEDPKSKVGSLKKGYKMRVCPYTSEKHIKERLGPGYLLSPEISPSAGHIPALSGSCLVALPFSPYSSFTFQNDR